MSQLVECILKAVILAALIPLLVSMMRGRSQWIVRHQQRLLQMLVVLGAVPLLGEAVPRDEGSLVS
ncbi:MAG: hypothetical protein ACJ8MH_18710 [Povalibacter sp.]